MPFQSGKLTDMLLDLSSVISGGSGDIELLLCPSCLSSVSKKKLPRCAIANYNFLGNISPELKDLTPVEESMISCC
jgi:hypothetical protein